MHVDPLHAQVPCTVQKSIVILFLFVIHSLLPGASHIRGKGTVQFKVGDEGSYITLPLQVKSVHFYCMTNASLTAFPT